MTQAILSHVPQIALTVSSIQILFLFSSSVAIIPLEAVQSDGAIK
jgi:hypothetical protein